MEEDPWLQSLDLKTSDYETNNECATDREASD